MTDVQEASGGAVDSRPSVHFFYLLLRDHVPSGVLQEVLEKVQVTPTRVVKFKNGWIAREAQYLADTLHREDHGCDFTPSSSD